MAVALVLESSQQLLILALTCVAGFAVYKYLTAGAAAASVGPLHAKRPRFLDRTRQHVTLQKKIPISHDTRIFRFALPAGHVLGLPVGKHMKLFAPNATGVVPGEWNGREDKEAGKEEISRPYTPTTSDDKDVGHFDLIAKVYRGGVIDRFPDGGKMSQHLDSLEAGDQVEVQGPFGLNEYHGGGVFSVSRKERAPRKKIGMIAGGTGITPMLQVITAILDSDDEDEEDVEIFLLFANQTEDDILLREELEALQGKHKKRFHLWYTLDRPPAEWKYSTGFISEEMVREHLPPAGPDSCVLLCGPPPMIQFACKPNLEKVGYGSDDIIAF